jgi:uncharacterized membrane protein
MKWLKHILQGKWLGHPLHPAIVHLPTGLWPAALLFDLLSCWWRIGGNPLVVASFACIAGGLLAVPLAVPTGLAEWVEIKPGKPARRLGIYHLILNVLATGLFLLNLWLRWDHVRYAESVTFPQAALSFVGVLVLAASGYLGGMMVYDRGIGVGRESKAKWRRLAEAGHANLPPAKEV